MKNHHVQTIFYWIILTIVFTGIVGYEWLPSGYRGSWLFILALIILGGFLRFSTALIVGIFAFIAVAIYFLLDLKISITLHRQILLLFIVIFAPLFLSAVRHNLLSTYKDNKVQDKFIKAYRKGILPFSNWEDFQTEFSKTNEYSALPHYEIIVCTIKNYALIIEMLGSDEWIQIQNKILLALQQKSDAAIYHFSNETLSEISSIVIRSTASETELPLYIQELKQLQNIHLEIEYHYCTPKQVKEIN